MRVFVTGSRGLVGHNVVENLSELHEVIAPGHGELNLLDRDAVARYMSASKPDIVIHCAGIVGGIQANIKEPARFLVENLEIGKNVVMSAFECDVPHLINLGSSCMYPREAPNPLNEDMILKGELEPTNEGYAIAKIAVQRLCEYLNREHPGLAYKTLMPCNLYGKWDKFDLAHSHMVPAVIRKLHEAKSSNVASVEIWGSGQARREFMYVGDLANCISFCIAHFEEMPSLMNVGLGFDYTIDEYYRAIAKVVGYMGAFTHDLTKPEGMARKLVDISRLTRFGWKAQTTIVEGIRLTYNHFLELESNV